jgi:c-di-GMP-binding flagellar brake protein YcgR
MKPEHLKERSERFFSHAIVEVRPSRWLPWGIRSGILLDVSEGGCKFEFASRHEIETGKKFWLTIPLSSLGISDPWTFSCEVECRWFDPAKYRAGVIFLNLSAQDQSLISQVVDKLEQSERKF